MNCEEIRLAAMALTDGEVPAIPPADIEAHLAECAACRAAMQELAEVGQIWEAGARHAYSVNLWPRIEGRLAQPKRHWLPVLVVMLIIFKVVDFVPDRNLSLSVQLVPLLIGIAVFCVLRQNPFQIKTELRLEEEES